MSKNLLQTTINYRPARISDYTAIAALHTENWRNTYRGILGDHYLDHLVEADRLETWQQRLTNAGLGQHVWLAEEEGRLVGFCCLILDEDPDFGTLIDNLHVSEIYRGKGIGGKLLREAARIVSEFARMKKMYLWVYESNLNAREAYKKMGAGNIDTIAKPNEEGVPKMICRYAWEELGPLL